MAAMTVTPSLILGAISNSFETPPSSTPIISDIPVSTNGSHVIWSESPGITESPFFWFDGTGKLHIRPPLKMEDIRPLTCSEKEWIENQHYLFQLGCLCQLAANLAPIGTIGTLCFHGVLVLSFLLMSSWSWVIVCAPDVFSWNFIFLIVNFIQTILVLYRLRPVKFAQELEDVYQALFKPLNVPRHIFSKLVHDEYAVVLSMYPGEPYANEQISKTDRLGLLIGGRCTVTHKQQYLHSILAKEFLDSPEFESSHGQSIHEKYQVTITAQSHCKYILWRRESLEYLLVKEPYIKDILSLIIGRDIAKKLYALNDKKMRQELHASVRLPSQTTVVSGLVDIRMSLAAGMGINFADRKLARSRKAKEREEDLDSGIFTNLLRSTTM
jgi:hypothetical protein